MTRLARKSSRSSIQHVVMTLELGVLHSLSTPKVTMPATMGRPSLNTLKMAQKEVLVKALISVPY